MFTDLLLSVTEFLVEEMSCIYRKLNDRKDLSKSRFEKMSAEEYVISC